MNFKKLKQKFKLFIFIAPSVFKVSAYKSGFQSDELNTSEEGPGGNKAFNIQTEGGIVSCAVPCVLA